jgi:DNA-directed RNA polymerase subunit beta'
MNKQNFDGLMVILASTQDIEKWSHGEVTHPETINYRTGKPKPKGLSCEAIFGPIKNYECSCGKYKGVRYKGIVCERCGVEVTTARVRRERMGHIDLAFPVLHVRYKSSPSGGVHQLLGLSSHDIEKILSFVKYVVVKPITDQQKEQVLAQLETNYLAKLKELDEIYAQELEGIQSGAVKNTKKSDLDKMVEENKLTLEKEYSRIKGILADLKLGSTVLESDYRNIFNQYEHIIALQSGSEALLKMLSDIDVEQAIHTHIKRFHTIKSEEQRKKAFALIKLLINLYVSGVKPEHMIIKKLPVIPPDLRPVVQLE